MGTCRCAFIAAALATAVSLLSCTDSGGQLDEAGKAQVQKYFSADDPGKWADQAVDHEIKVGIIEDAKGKKGIEVSVPFTSGMNEQHYVEAMALTDEKGKQLDAVRFKRGEKANTIFPVTGKVKFPVYVVAKCNMHDMWRKKVTGTEKGKEEDAR
jgi:desulfoferrodoxin (superoxide reductase-like protein)